MSQLSLRCIKAAFVYLALGIGLGAIFAFDRATGASLRTLHAELNLWGWVTLLIYGMAYHMLPRFTGRPLRWNHLATAQSWLAIGGVALASAGWLSDFADFSGTQLLLVTGGVLQLTAAACFTILIGDLSWRSQPA